MSFIAIIGAGATGGAIAHKAAVRDRVGEIRLIDDAESIARGKALDIVQSAPLDGFGARVTAASDLAAPVRRVGHDDDGGTRGRAEVAGGSDAGAETVERR